MTNVMVGSPVVNKNANTDDTETISFDDEPQYNDATPTIAFPAQTRTATGSTSSVYGNDYEHHYDFMNDGNVTTAMPSTPAVNNKKQPVSYAFSGGDSNLKNQPIYKRPLFWVVFIVIMLFVIVPIFNMMKPKPVVAVNETTSSSQSAPVASGNENKADDNNGGSDETNSSLKAAETFDWSALNGQKLSNAYQLMKYNGMNRFDFKISIVTNDGKTVLDPSNWTVLSSQYNGDGRLLINVKHDNTGNPISDTLNGAGNTVKDKVNDFTPENLGNTLSNTLGDLKNQIAN